MGCKGSRVQISALRPVFQSIRKIAYGHLHGHPVKRVAVKKTLFAELGESMMQMNEIVRGERAPSREFHVDAIAIKALRSKIGLSQSQFAALLQVNVGTLRNWERGLREPSGPAKALLMAISRDPTHVLKALAAAA